MKHARSWFALGIFVIAGCGTAAGEALLDTQEELVPGQHQVTPLPNIPFALGNGRPRANFCPARQHFWRTRAPKYALRNRDLIPIPMTVYLWALDPCFG